tara:strand:+ start:1774 stop:3012 length:1239 start_codon:yes stop_codon:yes gene_type:complete
LKFRILQILVGLILLAACRKNEPVPILPDPGPEQKLEYVWSQYLRNDSTAVFLSIDPQLTSDDVLFSTSNGNSEVVKSFNKLTGKLNWEWSDNNYQRNYFSNENALLTGNILFLCDKQTLYAIDALTGASRWTYTWPWGQGDVYIYTDGEYLYHRLNGSNPHYTGYPDAYIMRTPIEASPPQWDTVLIDKADTHTKRFQAIDFFTNTHGDKMMIGVVGAFGISKNQNGKSNLFLYNLNQKSLEYYKDNAMPNGAMYNPLYLDQDRVYVLGGWAVHAFDLQSGNEVWTYEHASAGDPNSSFAFGDFTLYQDKVLVKNRDEKLVCLDASDGHIIWKTDNSGGILNPGRIRAYNNKLFYCGSQDVYIVNISTGEILFKESPPNGAGAESTIAIDKQNNLIFFGDGGTAYCAKIPE